MSSIKNIELPDIGDFDEVEVIEILVNVGDKIDADDSMITLESDKASMEIPTPSAGIITKINVNIGDKIKQGDVVLSIETGQANDENTQKTEKPKAKTDESETKIVPVVVPDIGDFDEVEVIEILVNVGDDLNEEDSIITLESDKASMEIPTPVAGKVSSLKISLGDKLSLGDLILEIESSSTAGGNAAPAPTPESKKQVPVEQSAPAKSTNESTSSTPLGDSHASPSIRKLSRELGVDLSKVTGTGKKGRVLDTDLKGYVKQIVTSGGTGSAIPKVPVIDFSKFGETELQPLSRINKLSGKHLTACWLNIPHVTQFDEVNIDQMEAFRQEQKAKGV
ncbi:biotin/lipoyl-containing protein, partial [Candidatus Thioglobus sp.]|uniref:biotin/lipoyl-containing protein n=1 Tax=Candidatus Thioglobus sp. TaxID=2026721 RepID=UPI003242CCDB